MEAARRLIERLDRIERLASAGAPPRTLAAEIRTLLDEGDAWLAAEPAGTERARRALERCRERLHCLGGG